MYSCERLGENATEFRYAPIEVANDTTLSAILSGRAGKWIRIGVTASGAGLLLQSILTGPSNAVTLVGLALLIFAVLWTLACRSRVREESLLVVRELGVQVTAKYVDGREKSMFLDSARIKAILINEGITMHRVVFYLAFVVEGHQQMVVAFGHLQPRLHILAKIFRGTRAAILGEAGVDAQHDEDAAFEDVWENTTTGDGRNLYGSIEADGRPNLRRTDKKARRYAFGDTGTSEIG